MLRTEIQKRITQMIWNGTFRKVAYNGNLPSAGDSVKPSSIVVNETGGGITGSASRSSTETRYCLVNWRFEAVVKFDCEVDFSSFVLDEISNLNFSLDGVLVSVLPSGDFNVTHPPRKGAHNGTELSIGLTATTRR